MAATAAAVVTREEEDQKLRSSKKVKGGKHAFFNESSKPVCYGDLVDEGLEERSANVKRSFKETVVGQNCSADKEQEEGRLYDDKVEDEEMFDGCIVVEEKMLGRHECPVFNLSKWEEARIQRPWKKGLIVKLLGRKIGFRALENRLNQLWVSNGDISIIDLGNDFFLVTFTSEKDRDFALGQGPWLIYDHYLIVREWCPNFQPERASIDKVAVWVRFSGLPTESMIQLFFISLVTGLVGQ